MSIPAHSPARLLVLTAGLLLFSAGCITTTAHKAFGVPIHWPTDPAQVVIRGQTIPLV